MKERLTKWTMCACCMALMWVQGVTVCADEAELLRQVPGSANMLLLMKPTLIQGDASSKVEREITRVLDSAELWPVISTWQPQSVVMAAEMDIHNMAPEWEMAAIEFQQVVDVKMLSRLKNGQLDELAGHQVVWLENACILVMGPKQLTIVSPLNRQSATRWLQRVDRAQGMELSPYLLEKSQEPTPDPRAMTLIMDLQNVFRPAEISQAVAGSSLLQKVKPDPTQLFCGIRGFVFEGEVSEAEDSRLTVDFSGSTESLRPVAKRLMMNVLVKTGAMLEEFSQWDVQVQGDTIWMAGRLSPLGVRRIMSLTAINAAVSSTGVASAPATEPEVQSTPATPAESNRNEETTVRRATKRYFQNVTDSINSVANSRRPNLENAALWISNEARRIDRLSTTNVDPKMIEYGEWVSESMKYIVYLYHQSNNQIQSDLSSTTPVMGTTTFGRAPVYRGNRWGGGYRYSYAPFYSQQLNIGAAAQERRAVVDQNVGAANSKALEIFRDINQATDQIRKEMSEKYNDRF
ncbi:MAG: hypothetical protein MK108_00560 [Mariniblastus sp.]|nr:hypothetical protein [Mariniblastus sp.]